MKGLEKGQLAAGAAQLKVLIPAVVALFALLAAFFAWSGYQLHRDGSRRLSITEARNAAVEGAVKALGVEQRQLTDRLASPTLQAALAAGDLAAASQELGKGWNGASDAAVLPPLRHCSPVKEMVTVSSAFAVSF